MARRVAKRHPEREFVIATSHGGTALSPKVRNLEGALVHARHDLLLFSDSDTRLAPDELRLFVRRLEDPRVGYVYQPLVGLGERTWGAALENLRTTELCGMFCLGSRMGFGKHAVTGKGVLVRRSALDAAGGFSQVRDLHNDDHALAMLLPLIPLKDLAAVGCLGAGILWNRVAWRGQVYRMGPGTGMTAVPQRRGGGGQADGGIGDGGVLSAE